MKVGIVLLKTFGYLWLTAAGLLILFGIAGIWMKSGFSAVQEVLSPFNLANWIVTVITLAPGIGALTWAEKLNSKVAARAPSGKTNQPQIPDIAKNKSVEDVALWRQGLEDLNRDPLTGLLNRRGFEQQFEALKATQRFKAEPAALILVDVDRFKALNDGLGQAAGQSALRHTATVLKKQINDGSLLARSGDDEFVVWLPIASFAEGVEVGEGIRRSVEFAAWHWNGSRYPITVSCGVAAYPETVEDINKLREAADAALLKAKQEGRNRVVRAVSNPA